MLHVRDGEPRGTEFLVRACDGVAVDLRIVEEPSAEERRQLVAGADVVAEQFVSGWYGPLAVEAMSMEKPVLSYLRDDLRELYVLFSFAEDCPVVSAAPEEIESELRAAPRRPGAPRRARQARSRIRARAPLGRGGGRDARRDVQDAVGGAGVRAWQAGFKVLTLRGNRGAHFRHLFTETLLLSVLYPWILLTIRRERRRTRETPRVFWGTIPLISIKYHQQALGLYGYDSVSVVDELYFLTARTDFDHTSWELLDGSEARKAAAEGAQAARALLLHVHLGAPALRHLRLLRVVDDHALHAAEVPRARVAPPRGEEGRDARVRRRRPGGEPRAQPPLQARARAGLP